MDVTKWNDQVEQAVRKFARHQPPDVKDDLRQECSIALLGAEEKIRATANEDEARAFAYSVAMTTILNYLRDTGRRSAHEKASLDDPESSSIFDSLPAPLPAPQASASELKQATERLPEIERYIIRSCYLEEKTEDVVARELGRSRDWIKRTKQIALKKLRAILEKEK